VYGNALATVVAVAAVVMFVGIWVVLPLAVGRPSDKRPHTDGSSDG